MTHKHIYDKEGKQLCCTQEEKINQLTEEHSGENEHQHTESQSTFRMFLPAIISLVLLLIAIAFDNYFPQSWFTGWIRIIWYVIAYMPVGLPVIKEAFVSISQRRNIFRVFINEYCYYWCICYW
jgi:Cd2+/Zn2+-exporting ATPase